MLHLYPALVSVLAFYPKTNMVCLKNKKSELFKFSKLSAVVQKLKNPTTYIFVGQNYV